MQLNTNFYTNDTFTWHIFAKPKHVSCRVGIVMYICQRNDIVTVLQQAIKFVTWMRFSRISSNTWQVNTLFGVGLITQRLRSNLWIGQDFMAANNLHQRKFLKYHVFIIQLYTHNWKIPFNTAVLQFIALF